MSKAKAYSLFRMIKCRSECAEINNRCFGYSLFLFASRAFKCIAFFGVLCIAIGSCTTDIKDINKLVEQSQDIPEVATNVEILYSDSAIVKVRIQSPTMKRYLIEGQSFDEFTDGLKVEFLDKHKRVTSWLEADYALRKDKEKKVYIERNVILYNKDNDKLETDELVWDEEAEEIYTSRPVKISQPIRGDTSFGYGFKADQEFTRFEIKRKFSAIKNIEELTRDID